MRLLRGLISYIFYRWLQNKLSRRTGQLKLMVLSEATLTLMRSVLQIRTMSLRSITGDSLDTPGKTAKTRIPANGAGISKQVI